MTKPTLVFDQKERVGAWVAEQVNQGASWGEFYAMGVERDGQITSGIVFHNFNPNNASCHIACTKPDKGFVELVDHAFLYAFQQCGLKRLTGLVESDNEKALKLDTHIGFVPEGVMKQAGTEGQDVVCLVLWPENYFRGKQNGR